MSYKLHQAGEKRTYTADFSGTLAGDTIQSVSWSLAPALPGQELLSSGTTLERSCLVCGLTAGLIYTLTCTATGAQGGIIVETFTLRCPRP